MSHCAERGAALHDEQVAPEEHLAGDVPVMRGQRRLLAARDQLAAAARSHPLLTREREGERERERRVRSVC